MQKPIKTALSSFGLSGRVFHAPFLMADKRFQLVKILERTNQLSEGKVPGAVIVRNYDDIIHDPEIELVVVNTPNHLHYQMSKMALEQGKHVIVEKPFTSTSEEAKELIAIAERKGLVLGVYHNRRFDIDFQTVKKIIDDGVLGHLKLFESKIYRWKPELGNKLWKRQARPASGLLYDLGSHLIDQALTLFGKPKSIFADLAIFRNEGQVDDYFELIFDYGSLKVLLKSFLMSAIEEPRFSIYGDRASYQKFGADLQETCLMNGIMPRTPGWDDIYKNQEGSLHRNMEIIPIKPIQTSYTEYFNNIHQVIREGADLLVKPEEAMEVVRMIELGIQSHLEKRVIVL
jgi:scyllo-inositol 2-dehydrogenase (NADP+)